MFYVHVDSMCVIFADIQLPIPYIQVITLIELFRVHGFSKLLSIQCNVIPAEP